MAMQQQQKQLHRLSRMSKATPAAPEPWPATTSLQTHMLSSEAQAERLAKELASLRAENSCLTAALQAASQPTFTPYQAGLPANSDSLKAPSSNRSGTSSSGGGSHLAQLEQQVQQLQGRVAQLAAGHSAADAEVQRLMHQLRSTRDTANWTVYHLLEEIGRSTLLQQQGVAMAVPNAGAAGAFAVPLGAAAGYAMPLTGPAAMGGLMPMCPTMDGCQSMMPMTLATPLQ